MLCPALATRRGLGRMAFEDFAGSSRAALDGVVAAFYLGGTLGNGRSFVFVMPRARTAPSKRCSGLLHCGLIYAFSLV
jgi:hypothetical protein